MKGSGQAAAWQEIDEFDGGTGWIAYPDERLQRASHALVSGDGRYLVDPVAFDGIGKFLDERGGVAGIVVLLNRHKRDAAELANRFEVPVYLPEFMNGVARELDAPPAGVVLVRSDGRVDPSELLDCSSVVHVPELSEPPLETEESAARHLKCAKSVTKRNI